MADEDYLAQVFGKYQFFGDYDLIVASKPKHEYFQQETPALQERIAMCLCTSGSADIMLNLKPYHITVGDMNWFFPFSTIQIIDATHDFDLAVLVFSKFFMQKNVFRKSLSLSDILNFATSNPVIHLGPMDVRFYLDMLHLIQESVQIENNKFKDDILSSLVASMLQWSNGLIINFMSTAPVVFNRGDELVSKFLNLVEQNYRHEHRLEFYADQLCVTSKYLSVVCRQITRHTAGKLIMYFVISEAKKLLLESHLSIQQITIELGFPNQSTFGKYFKKEVGISPSQFRLSV